MAIRYLQVEQEHSEEFLAVGRALKINGLEEQETEEGDSTAAAAKTNIKLNMLLVI